MHTRAATVADIGEPIADADAERALLSAVLIHPERIHTIDDTIAAAMWQPRHEQTLHAIRAAAIRTDNDPTLTPGQVVATLDAHAGRGDQPAATWIAELLALDAEPLHIDAYVTRITTCARLRTLAATGTRLTQAALAAARTGDLDHVDTVLADAVDTLDHTATDWHDGATRPAHLDIPTITDFLTEQPATGHDWIIPGLLERQDRLILTAGEGAGKSTLLRQLAVCAAAGIHPFTGDTIPAVSVLILDLENPRAILARALGRLHGRVSRHLDPDRLHIVSRTDGIDLCGTDDRAWLAAVIDHTKPDLIVGGPAYKMSAGDTDRELDMKPVALFLDSIRQSQRSAIALEAHVGNEQAGSRHRPERPFGWSGWRRWPELGLYLDSATGELRHWRGDRDDRDWPAYLTRGKEWPFEAVQTESEIRWMQIRRARLDNDGYLSIRDLVELTGLTKTTIGRLIGVNKAYHNDWIELNGTNPYAEED